MKKIFAFLIIFIFLIFSVSLVSAFSFGDTFNDIKDFFINFKDSKFVDTTGKLAGFKHPTDSDTLLGIKIASFGSFPEYFFIGLLAGFLIWLLWLIVISIVYPARKLMKLGRPRDNPFKSYQKRWLGIVSGGLWKVFLTGVIYALVMQIPVLNRVVQVITLDLFLKSFWVKGFVLAIVIGILPSLVETFFNAVFQARVERLKSRKQKLKTITDNKE